MINKRALEKAINDTMRDQFAAQMRDFICHGAPKEITELYKRYVDECEAERVRRARQVLVLKQICAVLVAAASSAFLFFIWGEFFIWGKA